MATISGMDYDKMMNLIEEIDTKKTDMINVVDDIKAPIDLNQCLSNFTSSDITIISSLILPL